MQALLGPSEDLADVVRFNSRLRYLLVKLKKGVSREQLEAFTPDFDRCVEAGRGELSMVILTAECLTGMSTLCAHKLLSCIHSCLE